MSTVHYQAKIKAQQVTMSPQKKSTRVYVPGSGTLLSVETEFTTLNYHIEKLDTNKTEIIAYTSEGTKVVIFTLGNIRSAIIGEHLWLVQK